MDDYKFEDIPADIPEEFHPNEQQLDCCWTWLHVAMRKRAGAEILQRLLPRHPEAAFELDINGSLPLHFGLRHGAPEGSILLLLTANPEGALCADNLGMKPLQIALDHRASSDVVEALLNAEYPQEGATATASMSGSGGGGGVAAAAASANHHPTHLQPSSSLSSYEENVKPASVDLNVEALFAPSAEERELGLTPLHVAMSRSPTVEQILALTQKNPSDCMKRNDLGNTPLHVGLANKASTPAIFTLLKCNGGPASIQNREGETPLHLAMVHRCAPKVVTLLLDASNVAVKTQDYTSQLPLEAGIKSDAPEDAVIEVLNRYPDACGRKDRTSGTLLLHVAMRFSSSVKIVRAIMRARPEAAGIADEQNKLPLHTAMQYRAALEMVQSVLREYPKALFHQDSSGMTPLHWGVKSGSALPCIKLLLSRGKNMFSRDRVSLCCMREMNDLTPLHLGLRCQCLTDTLLDVLDADPSAAEKVDANGYYPLHQAMKSRAPPIIIDELLAVYPKAAAIPSKDGSFPLTLGVSEPYNPYEHYEEYHIECIELVLEKNPNALDPHGDLKTTPLHAAIRDSAGSDVIKFFVSSYPQLLQTRDGKGRTPLHQSLASLSDFEALEFVLSILEMCPGASNIQDHDGYTPLHQFIHSIYTVGEGSNSWLREINGEPFGIYQITHIITRLFEANSYAADRANKAGVTAASQLVSECCQAKQFIQTIDSDACLRLKSILKGIRDGRILKPLCQLDDKLKLLSFFALFDEKGGLEQRDYDMVPAVNLNHSPIEGKSLLTLLIDMDTVEAASIILQLVLLQEEAIRGYSAERQVAIEMEDGSFLDVDLIESVTEATLVDAAERAKLSTASVRLRKWGEAYGRLFGEYLLDKDAEPRHVSETCVVVQATELKRDTRVTEVPVVLKFMSQEDAFFREIKMRRNTNPRFVLPIKKAFFLEKEKSDASNGMKDITMQYKARQNARTQINMTGWPCDANSEADVEKEIRPYPKICLKDSMGSRQRLKFLLVMECGGGVDLHDFIGHQNIAGKDLPQVVSIAREVALCLQYLNESCGVLHGDVKARNFVARGVGLGFAAIDLDNAASIANKDFAGQKVTSTGYVPPEQARVILSSRSAANNRTEADEKTSQQADLVRLEAEFKTAFEANNKYEVKRLRESIVIAEAHLEKLISVHVAPMQVVATAQYDMWSYGVLLYYLCTGKQLFNVDVGENADHNDLGLIGYWSDSMKRSKLSAIKKGWPRQLLDQMLQNQPNSRPTKWDDIIRALDDVIKVSPTSQLSVTSMHGPNGIGRGHNVWVDRFVIFQSAPLAFFNRQFHCLQPLALLDFDFEFDTVRQAVKEAETSNRRIDVESEVATIDRFSAFFAKGTSRVMHISCHGDPQYLFLENGFGDMQPLVVDDLRRFVSNAAGNLQLVFVSACHSLAAGQAFIDAGVPHVICCRLNEQFRDEGATEFAKHFYRSLAGGKRLREAFNGARSALSLSPHVPSASVEAEKFVLLPEKSHDNPYHDVQVFFREDTPMNQPMQQAAPVSPCLPRTTKDFVGRELDIHRMLSALRRSEVVMVRGKAGVGKSSTVCAACRYVWQRRRSMMLENIFWLPPTEDLLRGPNATEIYTRLCELFERIMTSATGDRPDILQDQTLRPLFDSVVETLKETAFIVVIDARQLRGDRLLQSFGRFISDVLRRVSAKIILIGGDESEKIKFEDLRQETVELVPISFQSSLSLFGSYCEFVLDGSYQQFRTAREFTNVVASRHMSPQRRELVFDRIGGGLPSRIRQTAMNMTSEEFSSLLRLVSRQEQIVGSRVELDEKIAEFSNEKNVSLQSQDYLRARNLQEIIDELKSLLHYFPSEQDLVTKRTQLTNELQTAVSSKKFELADRLRKQMSEIQIKVDREVQRKG